DGAGGGGGEVQGVHAAAGLVDGVAAQGQVGVEPVRVVAGPADQRVIAAAAAEDVVAVASVDDRAGQRAVGLVQGERVVAAQPGDLNYSGVEDRGRPTLDGYGAVIDEDVPGRVAGDHDGVILCIARNGQHPGCGGIGGSDRRGGRVHLLGEDLRAAQEVGVTAVDGGDGVAARGREGGREHHRAAAADAEGPRDRRAVLESDRAGRRAGPRGDGGHRGREGHRLARDGRVSRRGQGDRGRGGVDGHGHDRRGAGGEGAAPEYGLQRGG